jgi:hypothetical protein
MKTKTIIQRNLDLSKSYTLEGVMYSSIEDGNVQSCDNCGKLICNIAHIKTQGKSYYIGLDCLDTILESNKRLISDNDYIEYIFGDKPAIQKAKGLRTKILNYSKKYPEFVAIFKEFKDSFGFSFDQPTGPRLGWDYTFNLKYKDLTLNYIKNLPAVKI